MSTSSTQSFSHKKRLMPSKLIMGLMVAAISVLAGTASVANATPGNGGNGYGGINIGIGNVNGNNNVIVIVINYFAGR